MSKVKKELNCEEGSMEWWKKRPQRFSQTFEVFEE
jgi:hypothetical protein